MQIHLAGGDGAEAVNQNFCRSSRFREIVQSQFVREFFFPELLTPQSVVKRVDPELAQQWFLLQGSIGAERGAGIQALLPALAQVMGQSRFGRDRCPVIPLLDVEAAVEACGAAPSHRFNRHASIVGDRLEQAAPVEQLLHQPVAGSPLEGAVSAEVGPDQGIDLRAE